MSTIITEDVKPEPHVRGSLRSHAAGESVRPLKVMRIIARLNVGGPAIHTILLTDRMDRVLYPTLLVTGVEGPSEGSMRYLAESLNVRPHVIPEMGREISWRDDVVALWKLIRLMRHEKPDVICTHTAKAGTLGRVAALIALAGRRKRIFHTFHGHVFHGYFTPRKTRIFLRIEQLLARVTDRLVAVTDTTCQELVEYGVAGEGRIAVIPLGFDLAPFHACGRFRGELRAELGLAPDALLLGIVARLVPIKRIDTFLAAVKQVRETYPNIHAAVVGDGELRSALEETARSLGVADAVHFTGFRTDLPRVYADLDLVVLSSVNEGLPVSIIEAMACGRVVVSTEVGGVPDLISDGETGY
ncbi:MAG TPA: glycosyltransferase, partial [Chthonomonadaceae bacterium]|nr:glycosyltransferase [Chthonomonadaceae bacterium]